MNTNELTHQTAPAPGERPARTFFHSLRDEKPRWWKPVLVLVLLAIGYLAVNTVLTLIAFGVEVARGTMTMDQLTDPSSMELTPLVFGASLLSLVALWPISMGIQKLFYPARRVGTLYSVIGRFRWRWAFKAAGIALVLQGIYYAIAMLGFAESMGLTTDLVDNALPWFLTVIVLMPAQAAAEEISFRGLLGRSVGSLFARAGVATIAALAVSTIIFGQAHFAADPWLIAYYTGFGLLMGVVTWRTGGIEAAVALHVVNNLLSGGLGALFSDMSGGIDRSAGNGSPAILVHLAVMIIIAAILVWLAGRDKLAVTTPVEKAATAPAIAEPWTPAPQRRTVTAAAPQGQAHHQPAHPQSAHPQSAQAEQAQPEQAQPEQAQPEQAQPEQAGNTLPSAPEDR